MSTEADWLHAGFSVGDGLFEGEEAVLHVIERIVAPLDLRVDNVTLSGRATSGRLSGADQTS
jgi:hypothetical protein